MAEQKNIISTSPGPWSRFPRVVYFAYYQEQRRGRTLREKDERNGAVSYDGLDTPELTGQEMIPDRELSAWRTPPSPTSCAVSCTAVWPCWTSRIRELLDFRCHGGSFVPRSISIGRPPFFYYNMIGWNPQ